MTQNMVNVILPFRADLAAVQAELSGSWGNPMRDPIKTVLDELGLIHFMGIHALPGKPVNHLVMELALDGSPERALDQLSTRLEEPLRRLLASAQLSSPGRLLDYLLAHRQPVGLGWFDTCGLNYPGTPGFSVRRIRAEAALAEQLGALVEKMTALPMSALEKLGQAREWLWSEGTLKWAFEEQALLADKGASDELGAVQKSILPLIQDLLWPLIVPPMLGGAVGSILGGPLSGLGMSTAVLALELAWLVWQYRRLRAQEQTDPEWTELPDPRALQQIGQLEDHCAQNHLIVLSDLKGGALRRFSLRVALFTVRQAVLHLFAPGKLGDIATIHFARWIVLPGTSQLLFMSNYGGSWDSYLEDFIIKAHLGLTGVWSNTQGFPRARNLFWDGATNGEQFKAWARRDQQPTHAWYSGYPQLSTARIRTNAAIRQGIAAAAANDEQAARRWLALFGAKRPEAGVVMQGEQVPALAFGGLPRSTHGKAWLLRFRDTQAAQRWLGGVHDSVAFGEDSARTRVLTLGFSASGLEKLGLDAAALSSFPVAFRHGPALRARRLGDVGSSAPEQWQWGARESIDVVVLLHADSPEALDELEADAGVADDACFAFRREVRFRPRSRGVQEREPFGFVDGISQPVLRGARRAGQIPRNDHVIEPGEVILGYPDESARTPRTPRLSTRQPADLGRHGTFLVIRQLQQDVPAFHAFCERAAATPAVVRAKPAGVDGPTWVAAKLVGRWPNGSSLVRHPHAPGPDRQPDNDFRYGAEDPDGLACPYGAHIRRANPRDSFAPKADKPLQLSNRHRLLRVGRVYEQGDSSGLMFMCLNADIERQFEFVQQTWIRAPSFHGLAHEVDPLLSGQSGTDLTVPTEQGPMLLRGISDFVQVIGSGYFFVPGRDGLRYLAQRAQPSDKVSIPTAAE